MSRFTLIAAAMLASSTAMAQTHPPTTPADWNTLYRSCMSGVTSAAQQQNLPQRPSFAPTYCGCMLDNLRAVPTDQLDTRFRSITSQCLRRAYDGD